MIKQNIYEANDAMAQLIRDNYGILQAIGCFGIKLGFGDKTVKEVCSDNNVDCHTFLAVVNYSINGYLITDDDRISVSTLIRYLQASHKYYLGFQLPTIRVKLYSALDDTNDVAKLIMNFYDAYAQEVKSHMKYEERILFPYVNDLLEGVISDEYNIEVFTKRHGQADIKLKELKNIIIKYLPGDDMRNNQLTATLYDLYNNEEWLQSHANIEDNIFVPAIRRLERISRNADVSRNISNMVFKNGDSQSERLSDREKEVVISLVQGMSNKQIAQHLNISVNTVITHRRNIADKLQIHSPAGLTIYAIINGLVDISSGISSK